MPIRASSLPSPRLVLGALGLAACGPTEGPGSATPTDEAPCALLAEDHAPPADEAGLDDLMRQVQAAFHPDLAGVSVALQSMDSDQDFFAANLDLSTAGEAGPDRDYLVRYGLRVLEDPPPYAATGAILMHELQHVSDYVAMDTEELADFAIWYASGDISEYERATDEVVLEAGCAEGLKAYRLWLYGQVDDETEAQKRVDYYTPEEIDAWVAASG